MSRANFRPAWKASKNPTTLPSCTERGLHINGTLSHRCQRTTLSLFFLCGWDSAKRLERPTANAKVATVQCPKLSTQFSRKQAQNARFLWLNTSVLGLFSRNRGSINSGTGFDLSIPRHCGIRGVSDESVLSEVLKKYVQQSAFKRNIISTH